jgi:MFS family permease
MESSTKTHLGPSTATVKRNIRWKNITTTLLAMWIVGMIDKIGVAVIATNKTFLTDMNLIGQNAKIGSLVSAMLFSYGIGFFLWGYFTDRLGPRLCAIIGLSGWGLSTAMAAMAPNFETLFISRILLGLTEAFLWPVSNSLTARWFPLNERGRAKSIWINGTNIGPGITGFLVTFLLASFEWRGVFWFLTAAALFVCLPMVIFLVRDLPAKDQRVSEKELAHIQAGQLIVENKSGEKNIRSTLKYWLTVLSFGVNILGVYGIATWFPSYLANAKHFSSKETSFYMLFAYAVALIVTFWIGAHTDKTHKKAIWTFRGYLGGAIFLFLASQIDSPVADALLVGGALTLLQGFTTPMVHGIMHSMSTTEEIGKNTGIMSGVANMIAAFIPAAMGALITLGHGSYAYAWTLLIGAFIIAAACGLMLKQRGY